jgi:hypothetical protein
MCKKKTKAAFNHSKQNQVNQIIPVNGELERGKEEEI